MTSYRAEFTADRKAAAGIAVRAAGNGAAVLTDPLPCEESRVTIIFDAPDAYSARTVALVAQGDAPADARIRTDSRFIPGPWYDLNED